VFTLSISVSKPGELLTLDMNCDEADLKETPSRRTRPFTVILELLFYYCLCILKGPWILMDILALQECKHARISPKAILHMEEKKEN